ncbi:MAG: hypothetical protein ACK553_04570, partial [Planctomycetota bacterium]
DTVGRIPAAIYFLRPRVDRLCHAREAREVVASKKARESPRVGTASSLRRVGFLARIPVLVLVLFLVLDRIRTSTRKSALFLGTVRRQYAKTATSERLSEGVVTDFNRTPRRV